MIFFKFLYFLFFINVNNSFKLINHFNYRLNNKVLYMGCDYYIENNLCIYYNDNSKKYINLNRERGYYSDYSDFIMSVRDKVNNMSSWEKMKQYHLTPKAIPFLIYTNYSFTNMYLSNKYKEMIDFEIINNDYKSWDDIKEIVIEEERYERD